MKKMNNKGFSLVELIIVIAIMAILAGAIAPALIRYIDKSRKSNDVTSAKAIKTAVESAMTDEDIYAYLTSSSAVTIIVKPGEATSDDEETTPTNAITISGASTDAVPESLRSTIDESARAEIGSNIGEKTPKIKYKKKNAKYFIASVNDQGTIYVGTSTTAAAPSDPAVDTDNTYWSLVPEVSKVYSK